MKQRTLFQAMDSEIISDRIAARREMVQRAREHLRQEYGIEKFVMDHLKANGPSVDANMMLALSETQDKKSPQIANLLKVFTVTECLFLTKKLWRKKLKWHPSNEQCWIYGIHGTHTP